MTRHQRREIRRRERVQVLDQRIDHAIPGFERHRLALVTRALQHERVSARFQIAQETPRQRGLAHARGAVQQQHARPLLGVGRRAIAQGFKRIAAPHEQLTGRMSRSARHSRHRCHPKTRCDLIAGRARRGIARDQRKTQRIELGWHPVHEITRPYRIALALAEHDLGDRAFEGQTPRQRFEQHHAQRIPIAGGVEGLSLRLFGRHITRRAQHALRAHLLACAQITREPEVEHGDDALARDQDSARLEIEVQLVRGMQRAHCTHQLTEHASQEQLVTQWRLWPSIGCARAVGRAQAMGLYFEQRRGIAAFERAHGRQEVLAFHVVHREQPRAIQMMQLMQHDQVGMAHVGKRAKLALEARERIGLGAEQDLDRHAPAQRAIMGQVHGAHTAFAKPALDLESVADHALNCGQHRASARACARKFLGRCSIVTLGHRRMAFS